MGLGRMQLEHEQIAAETATRRQLAVEEQMNEDVHTTQSRLQRAEQREKVEAQVQEIKKSFYCEVCNCLFCCPAHPLPRTVAGPPGCTFIGIAIAIRIVIPIVNIHTFSWNVWITAVFCATLRWWMCDVRFCRLQYFV